VKGKSQPVDVFEVYEANPEPVIHLKRQTRTEFERGVALYVEKNFAEAQDVFRTFCNEMSKIRPLDSI
jgi:two-component system sensor histidine kinase ChiS